MDSPDERGQRGRDAYEIYRQHRAESCRFFKGDQLIPWEELSAGSQEAWIRHANGEHNYPVVLARKYVAAKRVGR